MMLLRRAGEIVYDRVPRLHGIRHILRIGSFYGYTGPWRQRLLQHHQIDRSAEQACTGSGLASLGFRAIAGCQ